MNHQRPFALHAFLLLFALCALPSAALAQSASATLSGTVADQNGAVIPNTKVTIVSNATGLKRDVVTNDGGNFTVPLLQPGTYTVRAQHDGFKIVQVDNVILNVGDQKTIQIPLQTGDVSETVNVTGDAPLINESPAVGTVVDRQFVENVPLNGRSFQSLFELTPGVALVPLGGSNQASQFSVNGQRTNANYVTVDGVSANTGILSSASGGANPGQSGSGQQFGLTVQGTTTSLVSVDALQEFRIQTSTYAPEFGRVPGAQISLITKSGSNNFHGTLFEYFRNEALDANDWFNNRNRLKRPPTRQNQFGGTLGGPLPFMNFGEGGPMFHSRKDRTFFFFSYEGLRLLQPRSLEVDVPTLARRQSAHPAIQPYLNALPIPNGRDNGNGSAKFAGTWSDKAVSDATSLRIDHSITSKLSVFGRFSHTPSFNNVRPTGYSFTTTTNQIDTYLTIGSTWILSDRIANDLRVNFTRTRAPGRAEPDTFGGAVVPSPNIFAPGNNPDNAVFSANVVGGGGFQWGLGSNYTQRQFNIVDGVTYMAEGHNLKFGVDFRRINPTLDLGGNGFESLVFDLANLGQPIARLYSRGVYDGRDHTVAFDNLSLYAQDTWRATERLTLTYGLRWEFVPPPYATEGENAISLANIDNPFGGQVHIAPRDTPLWKTRYNNFAPRIGASYVLYNAQGHELVIRGGFGVFHDLGYGQVANGYTTYPFSATRNCPAAGSAICPSTVPLRFPLTSAVLTPPVLGVDRPSSIWAMDPNLVLPYTLQWNIAAEKAFGAHQTFAVSYVGAAGKKLLKNDVYTINLLEWPAPQFAPISQVIVTRNKGHSDYSALQFQFQRRLHHNLQSLVSYTFGRSRDTASSDISSGIAPSALLPVDVDYGYSDYDIRHLLAGAVTYRLPKPKGPAIWKALVRGWGIDMIFRARSALPIRITTTIPFPFQQSLAGRPNVIPDIPIWIDDPEAPGGRRLNTALPTLAQTTAAGCIAPTASNAKGAFCTPPAGIQGNLPRNSVRGFGVRQLDMSLHRDFQLGELTRLQLRIDAFNVTNTPNFADPSGVFAGVFGTVNQMLNRGLGGVSALYQVGGPRSIQLSTKFTF